MPILPDLFRYDDVAALALLLHAGRNVRGGTEVIENVIQVHGDTWAMVNADLERESGFASRRIVFVDRAMHFKRGFHGLRGIEKCGPAGSFCLFPNEQRKLSPLPEATARR